MNDQCRTCNLRGDMKKCEPVPCFNRDNWYAQEIIKERDVLKDRLARIDAARGKDVAAGMLCISHFRNNPGMENMEFQPLRSLPPGQYPLFIAQTIPEGMALVPIEPTEAMVLAGTNEPLVDAGKGEFDQPEDYVAVRKAMLSAAQGERK